MNAVRDSEKSLIATEMSVLGDIKDDDRGQKAILPEVENIAKWAQQTNKILPDIPAAQPRTIKNT